MTKKKQLKKTGFERLEEVVAAAVKKAQESTPNSYVDPKRKAIDDAMRKAMREAKARQDARIKEFQDGCPHLQGSCVVSESAGTLTSIVWHGLDRGGDVIGICQNCQRVFHPSDADYKKWFNKPSGNIMSAGGNGLIDPRHHNLPEGFQNEATALDKLDDQEVKTLYESTSELFKELRPVLDVDAVLGRKRPKPIIAWDDEGK